MTKIERAIRPKACANIYIHGRLKNETEMDVEIKRVMTLRFNDLISECKPITQDKLNHIKRLVEGVNIDLNKPL